LGVFIGLAFYGDIGQVGRSFTGFRWSYIPLVLVLAFLNYLIRFCRWDYYLRSIQIKLKWKDSMAIFLSGLSMTVTPAKLGEVFKSLLLKRINGTEVSRSVPVVIAERITDVLGLLILAAISFSAFKYGIDVLIVLVALSVALIAVMKSRTAGNTLLKICASVPILNKLSSSFGTAYESAHTLFGFKNILVATVLSVVAWGCECLAMYFVLEGFGVDVTVLLSTFVYSFSTLMGAVSLIPGGLIVVEGSSTGLLILAGISKGVAASATIVTRFCTLWFAVLVGLIALFVIRHKTIRDAKQERTTSRNLSLGKSAEHLTNLKE
jgi:uncharacterized protein (TIRG00374 family)